MKPIIRYRSQLLFRKSYKPNGVIRIRPAQSRTGCASCPGRSSAGRDPEPHDAQCGIPGLINNKPRAVWPRCAARADFRPVAQ